MHHEGIAKMSVLIYSLTHCTCARLQLADLQTDNEDVQRSVQQLKKKSQKLMTELQDTKRHLEGLQSRNHDLEKKQRKSVSVYLSVCLSVCPSHSQCRENTPPFSSEV